jgi:3-oxoacyl-[acyl-carrier-protein] synthase-3
VSAVYITRLSKYLPNEPVQNDEMEQVLGMINGKPSRAKSIVLRNNGIKTRYYAFRNGVRTHTNAELAANAVKLLFDDNLPISNLQLLAAGTTSPEQLLPSHAAMVHGELGINKNIEIISATGACCSGIQALKYAYMAIATGMSKMAAVSGSERSSSWMHASRFQPEADSWKNLEANPILAFEKDFLRWMLSDGAGAALLQSTPNASGISLKIEWVEITSYANEYEACMYAGAVKEQSGELNGWNDMPVENWTADSVFSVKQDTRLLGEHIVPRGAAFTKEVMDKHGLGDEMIDYYLPHMSSAFFKEQIYTELQKVGIHFPYEKWFYNLPSVGNVGSASPYLMMEELFNSGKLKKGDRLLVMVPESARFTYAYMYLTVV